jgi:hypothetical protein
MVLTPFVTAQSYAIRSLFTFSFFWLGIISKRWTLLLADTMPGTATTVFIAPRLIASANAFTGR